MMHPPHLGGIGIFSSPLRPTHTNRSFCSFRPAGGGTARLWGARSGWPASSHRLAASTCHAPFALGLQKIALDLQSILGPKPALATLAQERLDDFHPFAFIMQMPLKGKKAAAADVMRVRARVCVCVSQPAFFACENVDLHPYKLRHQPARTRGKRGKKSIYDGI